MRDNDAINVRFSTTQDEEPGANWRSPEPNALLACPRNYVQMVF
jgi:hypothetical protein